MGNALSSDVARHLRCCFGNTEIFPWSRSAAGRSREAPTPSRPSFTFARSTLLLYWSNSRLNTSFTKAPIDLERGTGSHHIEPFSLPTTLNSQSTKKRSPQQSRQSAAFVPCIHEAECLIYSRAGIVSGDLHCTAKICILMS